MIGSGLRSPLWVAGLVGVLALSEACDDGANITQPVTSPPRVLSATIATNPHSTLSTLVELATEHADSARLLYFGEGQPLDSTPYGLLEQNRGTLVALGLRPGTTYRGVVQVGGAGGTAESDSVTFAAGELPELLRAVTITTTGTGGPGLTLVSLRLGESAAFAVGFDSAGVIRWYREFEGTGVAGGDLKQQRNGRFTMFIGPTTGSQKVPGRYVEFTPGGDSVRGFTVTPPRYMDNHELLITTDAAGDERVHFFTYDHRVADLTSFGGATEQSLAGHQLVRLAPDGSTEFEWNGWDHLTLEEWIEPPGTRPTDEPDFDHPNSLDFDRDGNYIVSERSLGQVLKIDARSGDILWRLGGTKNEFTFVNDPLEGFSAQHSARILPNGNLLLFDNGTRHDPPESRAVEYALDAGAKTATLVWEFHHSPPIYTPFTGYVQRLSSGNTLVAYAFASHASEVTADGAVAWEADLTVNGRPPILYRLIRIASLYAYQVP